MLKKLKARFLLITMSLIAVVLLVIFSGIYFFMAQSEKNSSLNNMRNIAKADQFSFRHEPPMFQDPNYRPKPEMPRLGDDSFLVRISSSDEVIQIVPPFESQEQLAQIPTFVELAEEQDTMEVIILVNSTEVRFLKQMTDTGKVIVFSDRSQELNTLNRLLMICLLIGFLSFTLLFVITLYLAQWAIKPVAKAWEKQKQFVADASHELKTPLTVIATNTDVVLSNPFDYVENQSKWLHYIKTETERMTKLVNDLLYLAKVDDDEALLHQSEFNISEAFTNVCLPFESIIFESNKHFHMDITPDLLVYGDENRLKQLAIILLDNAIKNANEAGDIYFSLRRDASKNKLVFSVTNTGPGIPVEHHNKIFERFYRVDPSRARETGGYGLGLSIAKSIVTQHAGSIEVQSTLEGPTTFLVILPMK